MKNNGNWLWYYTLEVNSDDNNKFSTLCTWNALNSVIIWWKFLENTIIKVRIDSLEKVRLILDSSYKILDKEEKFFPNFKDAMWME